MPAAGVRGVTPHEVAATWGHVEACPECRARNGCKEDCGQPACACRGTCAACDASRAAIVARAWGSIKPHQGALL